MYYEHLSFLLNMFLIHYYPKIFPCKTKPVFEPLSKTLTVSSFLLINLTRPLSFTMFICLPKTTMRSQKEALNPVCLSEQHYCALWRAPHNPTSITRCRLSGLYHQHKGQAQHCCWLLYTYTTSSTLAAGLTHGWTLLKYSLSILTSFKLWYWAEF